MSGGPSFGVVDSSDGDDVVSDIDSEVCDMDDILAAEAAAVDVPDSPRTPLRPDGDDAIVVDTPMDSADERRRAKRAARKARLRSMMADDD